MLSANTLNLDQSKMLSFGKLSAADAFSLDHPKILFYGYELIQIWYIVLI